MDTLARGTLADCDHVLQPREARLDAGKGIAEDRPDDPHALPSAVVDRHVRRVAEVASPAGR